MSRLGASKQGAPIRLAEIQHVGKAEDAKFFAGAGEDDPVVKEVKRANNRFASTGPAMRRGFRRNRRTLSALDHQVAAETGKRLYSTGKNVKRLNAKLHKYMRQTRLLVGLLIRGTGAAAPSLIAHKDYVMPAYKRRIAELGTTISKPNLIAREDNVI